MKIDVEDSLPGLVGDNLSEKRVEKFMGSANVQAENIRMSGGGLYSQATVGARHVIDLATPRVISALEQMIVQRSTATDHWCFTDMGCADGGTSLDLWRRVITHIRASQSADVQIVYADQPNNDFNALIKILHGHTRFDSYLGAFANVTALESGASFYTPVMPRNTVDLGFSATAMHWLSRLPCPLSGHIHMVGAQGDEQQQFAAQAATDWETILLHRARELKVGGRLVLVNFCIDEAGRYLGNTGGVNMFNQFNENWQQMLDDGVINADEYRAMTLPQYYNTPAEFCAPLMDKHSAVYAAGLRLVEIETGVVPCPFAADFSAHGDPAGFAEAYLPTIRSWNESIFSGALSKQRGAAECAELIEAYYDLYRQQVAAEPTGHGMDYVHAYMTIERVS